LTGGSRGCQGGSESEGEGGSGLRLRARGMRDRLLVGPSSRRAWGMTRVSRSVVGGMLVAGLGTVLAVGAAGAAPSPLRVLILSGMNNHDWQRTTPALKTVYEDSGRFAVDVTDNPSSLTAETLAKYDLVTSNWTNFPKEDRVWGETGEHALLDFVRGGKGFALFHAAAASFPTWREYRQLIGAGWVMGTTAHGAIHTFEVTIRDRKHPITHGLGDFSIRDELWHQMGLQSTAHILCTAFSATEMGGSGKDEPVALVTELGKGRCLNLVLGHDAAAMVSPGWRLLMLRGSEWAATGKVTIFAPVDVDIALRAAAGYQRSQSRAPLAAAEMLVQRATVDAALRQQLAAKMAQKLQSETTSDCKAFLLQQLGLIGSAQEVPAAAALIGDPDLAVYALGALQRIPGDVAAAALRRAMTGRKGTALVGAINALGEKRDRSAVAAISGHLTDQDDVVARAAVDALGKIGGASATEALKHFAAEAGRARRAMAADALLTCADGLRVGGDLARARVIYESLSGTGNPEQVRAAAFFGAVACAKGERAALVLGALGGDDRRLQAAAARCIRELADRRLAESVASRLGTLSPPVQALVIGALGESGQIEAAPAVGKAVSSGDPQVRIAAVRAIGRLGGAAAYPILVRALRASASDAEREEVEKALVGVCRRAERGSSALPFGLSDLTAESAATRSSLLRVLGLLGDAKALEVLRAALRNTSGEVRSAAISALAEWPDGAPVADLLAVAGSATEAPERAAALRAIAALAPRSRGKPEATVAALADAIGGATGADEKRALLGALAQIRDPAALTLASACIDDPTVSDEASVTATRIAQSLPVSSKAQIQAAMEKVLKVSQTGQVRTPAKTLLHDLGIPVEVTQSEQLTNVGPNLALGAIATSPDGIDSDGAASGDQAAIDGDPATYWDEVDNQAVYVLRVTLRAPTEVSAIRITGHAQHSYAPKDFGILCDDQVVKTIKDAWYESNQFATAFPPTRCTSLELRITGYWGLSPAIRELEILGPAK